MDNAENEEKNDKENHEKPIKFEINNQKQFFKKEDEVKECEEESKNVNEFEEDQGTNEVSEVLRLFRRGNVWAFALQNLDLMRAYVILSCLAIAVVMLANFLRNSRFFDFCLK
uniref:Uncharacterized protein n=1 Tax=Meloidogyne hapla TaxID=6305 RepID=A0A1I8B384_MELHA